MDPKRICFIVDVDNEEQKRKSLSAIQALAMPEDMELDIILVDVGAGAAPVYNEAMKASDAKYKVYVQRNARIVNPNFIVDAVALFRSHARLGLIGMAGADQLPASGSWQDAAHKYGKMYENRDGTMAPVVYGEVDADYRRVAAVDGLLMATQYDVPWQAEPCGGRQSCGPSQALAFMKAGYEAGVPSQAYPWCVREGGMHTDSSRVEPNSPLLSIAIPTYNRADILEQCLASIYSQIGDDANFEVVVSNNASTDHTERVALAFASRYPTMRYSRTGENIGADRNVVRVLQEASGRFVLLHGDDDYFIAGTLYDILHVADRHRSCGMLFLNVLAEPQAPRRFTGMDSYLREASIHATFISSLVFNRKQLAGIPDPLRFAGSLLNQLHLQYSVLEQNPEFCVRYGPVFYPSASISEYSYAEVFIKNYLRIISDFIGRGLTSEAVSADKFNILGRHLFPQFQYIRRSGLTQFEPEKFVDVFIEQYAGEPYFEEAYRVLLDLMKQD
ncbi:glycosyltransferase [Cohnella rhizosphaerae]|uniref:Glycosyltransferase n=1 Tax=Cohnella rhizosphaerae TaxID=1457232 RepID=A0A9X4QV52_9BACL|nr:glycosyltransferase [Cohnella rhizosphaerae]MDG0811182.1 glycosyltransferase [Cohnella rhizosphaerae]